ncbi:hypothetical protein J2Z75_005138 [Rhizobium herbae]|uniref:Uncharacterized protein n=1 Tax=Rhizobium herbae TaxID=508661 RepID=A0ABS4EUI7_9HYPH|nr:hypothetical protein [Rhizobium herbae]MBP1861609.1 hypothetical protein [Rhizobium herbae]
MAEPCGNCDCRPRAYSKRIGFARKPEPLRSAKLPVFQRPRVGSHRSPGDLDDGVDALIGFLEVPILPFLRIVRQGEAALEADVDIGIQIVPKPIRKILQRTFEVPLLRDEADSIDETIEIFPRVDGHLPEIPAAMVPACGRYQSDRAAVLGSLFTSANDIQMDDSNRKLFQLRAMPENLLQALFS